MLLDPNYEYVMLAQFAFGFLIESQQNRLVLINYYYLVEVGDVQYLFNASKCSPLPSMLAIATPYVPKESPRVDLCPNSRPCLLLLLWVPWGCYVLVFADILLSLVTGCSLSLCLERERESSR